MLGLALVACTALAPAPAPEASNAIDWGARYQALRQGGGQVFRLDPAKSTVRIYAFRAGAAARVGHNHVLSAPRFVGYLYLPAAGEAAARFDLEFRLDELEVDAPGVRDGLGRAFATPVPPEAIAAARAHMLGDENLQAERFPLVRIRSLEIAGEAPKLMARVAIDLHGQTREQWLALTVDGLPTQAIVQGAFVLRQSDFGAQPYSVLGGLIAVQDAVLVEFKLAGEPTRP